MQVVQTGISFGTAASDYLMQVYSNNLKKYARENGLDTAELTDDQKAKATIGLKEEQIDTFCRKVAEDNKELCKAVRIVCSRLTDTKKYVRGERQEKPVNNMIDKLLPVYQMTTYPPEKVELDFPHELTLGCEFPVVGEVKDAAKGICRGVRHPVDSTKKIWGKVNHPKESMKKLWKEKVKDPYNRRCNEP